MNVVFKKSIRTFLLFFLLYTSFAQATHNISRYFPFLERSEDCAIKNRSHLTPSLFYVNASTAFRRGGGSGGIPELWGKYDLKDVIASLQAVNPAAVNQIYQTIGGGYEFDGKSLKFRVGGKVNGYGLALGYEHDFGWAGLQTGVSIPVMAINTTSRYGFDRQSSDAALDSLLHLTSTSPAQRERKIDEQEQMIDKIRRATHKTIGFEGNEWDKTGFGDLDAHVRWNHIFDHVWLMRSIDLNFQLGVIAPTGITSVYNTPASVSVGSNGHWGLYGDVLTAFELKQDWTLGLMFGFAHLFPHTRQLRIPVGAEPAIFSSLVGRVRMEPGDTLKIAPYFTLGNLTDGLDFQVRYTYLRHDIDTWKDVRADKTIQSYLDKGGDLVAQKETLSLWRAHYVTLQLMYDTQEAMKNIKLDPVFFAAYDMPVSGNGIVKTHQISLGVELHF